MHLLDKIEHHAWVNPDRIAITHGGDTLTYAKLWATIIAVAKNATDDGAKPGDRFLFAAKPTPFSLAATLGLLRAGLTLVFVDPFSAPALFKTRADLVGPRYVVSDSLLYLIGHKRLGWALDLAKVTVCDYAEVTQAKHLYLGPWLPGLPRLASAISVWFQTKSEAQLPVLDGEQPAIITFTSGTTGDPKGVVHTLSTISANLDNFGELFNVQPGDLIYSEPMTVGIVSLAHGANWWIPEKHTPAPGKIDLLFGVPTEILAFLEKTKNRNIVVKAAATGAAPVLPSLVWEIDAAFGADCRIVNVYGMTEMLPVAVCDARLKAEFLEGDLLGTPIGDTRVKIAEDGEILVQGSGLMKHYFGREPQQWHPTGDLGFVNENGMVVMLGRKKNMLIRGNKNIYPSLYEPGLTTIEGVADAVLSGSPDEFGDDRVVLFIAAKPGFEAAAVLERVKARQREFIDADALPDRIKLLASVPTSGRANKIDMPALAALAKEIFEGANV